MGNRLPKAERRQLVIAEVLIDAAVTVQRWADDVAGRRPGVRPFADWPDDDRHRQLAATYELTPAELAAVIEAVADRLEAQAERAGYDRTLDVHDRQPVDDRARRTTG